MKIFPIYYFPPISWFTAVMAEKEILLEQYQHYRKQQFTNRMYIQGPNAIQCLSFSVKRELQNTPIKDISINYGDDWKKDHWKSLECAYRRSPFFEYYEDRIEKVFSQNPASLLEFNLSLLQLMLELLQIEVEWKLSDSYQSTEYYQKDYRNEFDSKLKKLPTWFEPLPYTQVFRTFEPDLSILDLLFNEGPATQSFLKKSFKG